MNKEDIKSAILKATGNPESGVVVEFVDAMTDAVWNIDHPEVKSFTPVKETRVQEVTETR